jgi:hypothetical protein
VASRQRRTYWGRFGVALAALLVGAWYWLELELGGGRPGSIGGRLFVVLSAVAWLYALGSGLAAADAISREKREGTLGFLFLTDLRGYDVVLGKLLARGLPVVLGVVAMVPVMSIALLFGGVSASSLARVSLLLLNTLLLSLAGGLWVSAMSRDARKSASGVILLLLVLTLGLPLLGILEIEVLRPGVRGWPRPGFFLPSPLTAYGLALGMPIPWPGGRLDAFWWALISQHALVWLLVGLTSVIAPRVWRERGVTGPRWPWQRAWHWVLYGTAESRVELRRRLLDLNPICWLSSRERWKRPAVWGMLAFAVAAWCVGWHYLGRDWLAPPVAILTALCCHGFFKYWLATEACRRFSEDRQSGAFELVLATPMSVPEILRGQWLALGRVFGWAWGVLLLLDAWLLWGGTRYMIHAHDPAGRGDLFLTFAAGIIFLVVHFAALGWVGMWRGLTTNSPNRAVSLTVIQVMVLPWLIYWMLWVGVAGAAALLEWQFHWQPRFLHYYATWFPVMLGFNLASIFWARRRLLADFRTVVAQRYEPRRPRPGSSHIHS